MRIGPQVAFKLKASEREESGTVGTGEIAEVADADKASGQHMLAEAAQELGSGESHDALLIAVSIVFPSKAHAVTIEVEQALVADGHAVGIAAEIAQHVSRPTQCGLGIDHPVILEQGAHEGGREVEVARTASPLEESEKLAIVFLKLPRDPAGFPAPAAKW